MLEAVGFRLQLKLGILESNMEFWYEWRMLVDGLLKEPAHAGPYYDRDSLMQSYETEEAAYADWARFTKANGAYATESEMVLLKFFRRP